MKHSLLIKREDGNKFMIDVSYNVDYSGFYWTVIVSRCLPSKRTFRSVHSADDNAWRRLNHEDRKKHELDTYLQYVTAEEILQAKTELWQKLKPV